MTTTTVDPTVLFLQTIAWNEAARAGQVEGKSGPGQTVNVLPPPALPSVQIGTAIHCETPTSTDTPTIKACIKACESGDYAEASHPDAGSGAFQYTPGTWRTWFGRWVAATGYAGPTYSYAYQAPPDVQETVTTFTIENGGAHNWDPRYGHDPCTTNLP